MTWTDNPALQILCRLSLGLPAPRSLHPPLGLGADGEKLSKQNGAQALNLNNPLAALNAAAQVLGLEASASSVQQALLAWTTAVANHAVAHSPMASPR